MENLNQPVIKKNYKTFKEAFDALPPATKKHSLRVADYTKTLFIEAMAIEMRLGNPAAMAQLEPEHERGAYLCGLYHDIGKVFVPVEYHNEEPDFSPEEQALYRKHVADGKTMTEQLAYAEELSKIEKQMIQEAITFHHQKPNNMGFPEAKEERHIPLMALLVGFADYLDHRVTVRRSETPFEDVMAEIMAEFPGETELELLLQECQSKLRRVFVKYQDQSLKIPTIAPFVKRKAARSFELKYRPMVDRKTKQTVAVQAKMYFKDNKDTYVEYEEVKTIINKNKLVADVGRYFIYEAGDTMKRIELCEVPVQYIALELMPAYFTQSKAVAAIRQQLEDMRMEPGKIVFQLDESMFMNPAKALMTTIERMTKAGIPMMLYNWTGEYLKAKEIPEYNFTKVAIHPSLYEQIDKDPVKGELKALASAGVEIIAGEFEKAKYNTMLNGLNVNTLTGPTAGEYLTEDEMILGELRLQQGGAKAAAQTEEVVAAEVAEPEAEQTAE